MKKRIFILLFAFISITAFSQTVTVGTGTSVWSYPFEMSWGYFRYAFVYRSTEIGTTGDITSLGWYIESLEAEAANGPVKIYLKTIANPFIGGETWADITSGATLVYDATAVFTAGGWESFSLSTPFTYSSDHLLVLVETNYGGTGSGEAYTSKNIRYTDVASGLGEVWHQDNTPPTGTAAYTTTKRPNIQLQFDQATSNNEYADETETAGLSVYPNPASQSIFCALKNVQKGELNIFNFQGQKVFSEKVNGFKGTIDVSSLPKGCYMVSVVNEKVNLIQRFIVQ